MVSGERLRILRWMKQPAFCGMWTVRFESSGARAPFRDRVFPGLLSTVVKAAENCPRLNKFGQW
jgi:hypothetical protein